MKKCEVPGCNYMSFGKDKNTGIRYCASHQWKRSDKKQRRKAILSQLASDADFYVEVWHKRVHRCNECGIGLGPVHSNWMFHHLVEKRMQKYYSCDIRHDQENVVLVCLTCHDQVRLNIDKVPIIKRMTCDQLTKYKPFLKKE